MARLKAPARQGPLLLLSCEHASNALPAAWRGLFPAQQALLYSHRGLDIGALEAARRLARALDAPLLAARWSRLLVDLNRSSGHPRLFAPQVRALPAVAREEILARCYRPYRDALRARVATAMASGQRVVHVSVHSFTPVLDGVTRRCDIGLLYDPARLREKSLCLRWQQALGMHDAGLVVRRNYPYRGTADGLVTTLRREFPPGHYAGIELEINQRHALGPRAAWLHLLDGLAATLAASLNPAAAARARTGRARSARGSRARGRG